MVCKRNFVNSLHCKSLSLFPEYGFEFRKFGSATCTSELKPMAVGNVLDSGPISKPLEVDSSLKDIFSFPILVYPRYDFSRMSVIDQMLPYSTGCYSAVLNTNRSVLLYIQNLIFMEHYMLPTL